VATPAVRPVPQGLPLEVASLLTELRTAVLELQTPTSPGRVYRTTVAKLPRSSLTSFTGCVVDVSDLNTLAKCDGTNWIRIDTGASI
jgi:hypothetical protein